MRKVEKIDVTYLFQLKCSSRSYYVSIPPELVRQYELAPEHVLKLKIIEVRKPFEEEVIE